MDEGPAVCQERAWLIDSGTEAGHDVTASNLR